MTSLLTLPTEIIEQIFFQMHPLEVVKCRPICKGLQQLIDGSVELQLCIDLAIDGYLLGYRGKTPAKDIRDYHQKRRAHVEEMRYSEVWKVPYQYTGQFEIFDGILAETMSPNGDKTFRGLRYREIAPPQRKPYAWVKEWEDLGLDIIDFSFWTHGDLQMLIETRENNRRIHFRTISTNKVHPEARLPYLDIDRKDCLKWERCNSVTYEDRIALHFSDSPYGHRLAGGMVISGFESEVVMPYMSLSDIAFLSRDEVLLLLNGEDGGEKACIGVYSIPRRRLICRCRFPFFELPFTGTFLTRPESRFGDKKPFSMAKMVIPDPLVSIIGVSFYLKEDDFDNCTMVLSTAAFRKAYISLLENHPNRNRGVFEWEVWGPSSARWLPHDEIGPAGVRVTCGSRILVWGRISALGFELYDRPSLMILDFNPRPIWRNAGADMDQKGFVVDFQTRWQVPHQGFEVTSELPFRVFLGEGFKRDSYYRFDGSFVVGRTFGMETSYSFLPLMDNYAKESEGKPVEIHEIPVQYD
ncbi:hypothetical protein CPB86DRAFT_307073 [Serendipita vermifera]|nr:hypothetical protein CPB86DRAFT_307073 [Serendipita vermifera]